MGGGECEFPRRRGLWECVLGAKGSCDAMRDLRLFVAHSKKVAIFEPSCVLIFKLAIFFNKTKLIFKYVNFLNLLLIVYLPNRHDNLLLLTTHSKTSLNIYKCLR